MTTYKSIRVFSTEKGMVSEEGHPVEVWQFGGDEDRPDWLPEVSHIVTLPHIGNPDWNLENFVKGAVWGSVAYSDSIYIGTPLGWHRCAPTDWVIRDGDGELRIVSADEFASYYREIT
ncbi:hypothetical protein [Rhizobium sp. BK602]|uniref:hypothetical protein n=1 Tax=Rhizobium sp. BK602 TaxID=2586986 RepID=UPI00161126C6|nr:hypothetical protein [Rhizobium sp. BK602]MBB3608684.1 hypothetical protein [Rhizobium sp. BK602]